MRRAVELPPLALGAEMTGGDGQVLSASSDGGGQRSAGGAVRSNPKRAAKRLSPYGRPPPPPPLTTGLSSILGGVTIDSGRKWKADGLTASAPTKQAAGPLGRQRAKEEKWRLKLAADMAAERSLWDKSSELLADPSAPVAVEPERAPESSARLQTLLSGRIGAQEEQKRIDAWRGSAVDDFLAGTAQQQPKAKPRRRRTKESWTLPPLTLPAHAPTGLRTWPEAAPRGAQQPDERRAGVEALSPHFLSRPRLSSLRPLDSRADCADLHQRCAYAAEAMERVLGTSHRATRARGPA